MPFWVISINQFNRSFAHMRLKSHWLKDLSFSKNTLIWIIDTFLKALRHIGQFIYSDYGTWKKFFLVWDRVCIGTSFFFLFFYKRDVPILTKIGCVILHCAWPAPRIFVWSQIFTYRKSTSLWDSFWSLKLDLHIQNIYLFKRYVLNSNNYAEFCSIKFKTLNNIIITWW